MNSKFPLIAAVVACAAVFFLMVRLQRLEKALHRPEGVSAASTAVASQPEVAEYMGRIQGLANKLWSAGKAGNLPLSDFYRHELKEQMETIAGAHIMDDGVDVSEKMNAYGLRTVDAMKQEFAANGLKNFDAQYGNLIATCNSCHAACSKPFLVMKVPTYTRYDDQDFSPVAH
jgi:hypothetical protein